MQVAPHIQAFFDDVTNTVSYLVSDPSTRRAAIIDPVLNFDQRSGKLASSILRADVAASLPLRWSKLSTGSMMAARRVDGSETK